MPGMPQGTVTFLFTDIQGSTRLWEIEPAAMRTALAHHDNLLHAVLQIHHGHVFKTMGDAFCVAFESPTDALSAALAAQHELAAVKWPEPVVIKVRMALHSGAAELREKDYYGQTLNRIARLMAAAHGGQVVLSQATEQLVRDGMPPGCALISLGDHRLRDLNRPESVFQLSHPSLPAEFPPLNSLGNSTLPNNLPVQLTSFVGRQREMAQVKALLEKCSLLTLTGSGGCGKTRLALQAAADVMDQFPDGVWFVEMASLKEPGLVPQSVANVLGLVENPGQTATQSIIDRLKSTATLLVIDNCEHLLQVCAELSQALLRVCPKVKVLASSREGLGIAGEMTYRVPSLSLPRAAQSVSAENAERFEAVQLFVSRARYYDAAFAVTVANVAPITSVCRRLDGIPLAIELAAARLRSLSIEEINSRLDNRFRLLTGGSKTALPRQQTLRSLIDWSYDLLNAQERRLFAILSAFAGGWQLKAAEAVASAVCPDSEPIEHWEVLDLLTSLVDKSMVVANTEGQLTRYRFLETVNQYARERLAEFDDNAAIRSAHRDYYLGMAELARTEMHGPRQAHWLTELETEHDNLRLALNFSLESGSVPDVASGVRLGAALWRFWRVHTHHTEGRARLAAIMANSAVDRESAAFTDLVSGAGVLALDQGEIEEAQTLHERCLAIRRAAADKQGIAATCCNLAFVFYHKGDAVQARSLMEDAYRLNTELGNRNFVAVNLNGLGSIAQSVGEYQAARDYMEQALAILRELGNGIDISISLNNLGDIASTLGDYDTARKYLQECCEIDRELGNRIGYAGSVHNIAGIAYRTGNLEEARRLYLEAMGLANELGHRSVVALCQNNLGCIAKDLHEWDLAATLLQECLATKRQLGDQTGMCNCLVNMSTIALHQGDDALADSLCEESLTLARETGDRPGLGDTLIAMANLAQARSDHTTALSLSNDGLTISQEIGDRRMMANALESAGHSLLRLNEPVRSVRLVGAALALRDTMGIAPEDGQKAGFEAWSAKARTALGDAAYQAELSAGRAMPLDEAIVMSQASSSP